MKLIFSGILFILSSCSNTQITGQYIDDKEFAELQNDIKDKQSVLKIFGSPTFAPDNEPRIWYYISRNLKVSPLSKPKLAQQRVVKLTFDSQDRLIDVELKKDLADSKVHLENSSTYTKGKQESSVQHFIKNFGRFNVKREKKR
jgi:outer membrane protein assembly factor BamE (lipoprotein component of BamABCDE complex)